MAAGQSKSPLTIPMIVGITGHRDIIDSEDRIREAMELFWNHLAEIVPGTRFILLSCLTRGADHLAIKYRPKNVDYCAVLPFEQAEYEKSFSRAGKLNDFQADLWGAYKIIRCDASPGDFSVASDFVRRHSDFLLTLWDGQETLDPDGQAKKGGTYHQIRGAFNLDDILVEHQEKRHAVVNIRVNRETGHGPNEKILLSQAAAGPAPEILLAWNPDTGLFTTCPFLEWKPAVSSEKNREDEPIPSIDAVVLHMAAHNAQQFSDRMDENKLEKNDLYADMKHATADKPGLWDEIRSSCIRFTYFDDIAEEHQKSFRKEFRNIAILSFVAGLFGQSWGDITFSSDEIIHERILHGVLALYLVGCICTALYYYSRKKNKNYKKYIYPRVIAELMRLKIFWSIARIPQSFFVSILSKSTDYQFALPICNWEIEEGTPNQETLESMNDRLDLVKERWIDDQISYYDRRSGEYEQKDARFKKLKRFFFWTPFLLAVGLLAIFLLSRDLSGTLRLPYYREIIIGVFPFLVSTIGWFLEKNNWDAQAVEYRRMADLFRKTAAVMKEEPDGTDDRKWALIRKKRVYIRKLMEISHDENSDWQEIKHKSGEPEPMF